VVCAACCRRLTIAVAHSRVQVQCCTDDGVWRLVARNVRGNTVKVPLPLPFIPASCACTLFVYLNGVQIRNLVEGKSYKFRLRCCFGSKEAPAMSAMSALPLRDDAAEPELLHWSSFGPPSDDFKVKNL
jgi:hypothetical protein